MDYCCQRFAQSVEAGEVVRSEPGDETAWFIPELWHLSFCPFCGTDISHVEADNALVDMNTIEGLLRRIGGTAYFSGVKVAGPNTPGLFGTTPLHIAATWGDCEAIRMLVEAGADLDAQGEYGFTPLMEAVSQGNGDAVRLLVELGAAPLANEEGLSPSGFAAVMKHAELESYLKGQGY